VGFGTIGFVGFAEGSVGEPEHVEGCFVESRRLLESDTGQIGPVGVFAIGDGQFGPIDGLVHIASMIGGESGKPCKLGESCVTGQPDSTLLDAFGVDGSVELN